MKYTADVMRIATSTKVIEVEADSIEDAEEKILKAAANTDFGTGDTQAYDIGKIKKILS